MNNISSLNYSSPIPPSDTGDNQSETENGKQFIDAIFREVISRNSFLEKTLTIENNDLFFDCVDRCEKENLLPRVSPNAKKLPRGLFQVILEMYLEQFQILEKRGIPNLDQYWIGDASVFTKIFSATLLARLKNLSRESSKMQNGRDYTEAEKELFWKCVDLYIKTNPLQRASLNKPLLLSEESIDAVFKDILDIYRHKAVELKQEAPINRLKYFKRHQAELRKQFYQDLAMRLRKPLEEAAEKELFWKCVIIYTRKDESCRISPDAESLPVGLIEGIFEIYKSKSKKLNLQDRTLEEFNDYFSQVLLRAIQTSGLLTNSAQEANDYTLDLKEAFDSSQDQNGNELKRSNPYNTTEERAAKISKRDEYSGTDDLQQVEELTLIEEMSHFLNELENDVFLGVENGT